MVVGRHIMEKVDVSLVQYQSHRMKLFICMLVVILQLTMVATTVVQTVTLLILLEVELLMFGKVAVAWTIVRNFLYLIFFFFKLI